MSILLAIFIFVVLPVSVSILGLLLVRKFTELSTLESHNEVAGFIYAVIGVLYALLLAFVVIDVWEQYRDSENYTELEATSLVNVCRNVEVFPDSVKAEIQENIYKYAEQMVELEFPAMYNKTTNEELEKTYNRIWQGIYNYIPDNNYNQIWYQETVKEMNEFDRNRKMRIFSISQEIPSLMWIVLIMGAALTILFSYLFGTQNVWAHIIMVLTLSSMICITFLLVAEFDHPFGGLIHVTPEAFERSLINLRDLINN